MFSVIFPTPLPNIFLWLMMDTPFSYFLLHKKKYIELFQHVEVIYLNVYICSSSGSARSLVISLGLKDHSQVIPGILSFI
jgi:hypothetical protein